MSPAPAFQVFSELGPVAGEHQLALADVGLSVANGIEVAHDSAFGLAVVRAGIVKVKVKHFFPLLSCQDFSPAQYRNVAGASSTREVTRPVFSDRLDDEGVVHVVGELDGGFLVLGFDRKRGGDPEEFHCELPEM
jgi:hypothetical protein